MTDSRRTVADPVAALVAALVFATPGADVVDVGGGSGTRAVQLAVLGCSVTVVDSSTDALASLRRRAVEQGVSDRIRAVQADADQLADLLPAASADLVLCHNVLESVENPTAALAGLVPVLRPGGRASVLVAGRWSAALGNALAGRFQAAGSVLRDPEGRTGPGDPQRRFDIDSLSALLSAAGLTVESVSGVGVVAGVAAAAGRQMPAGDVDELAELERLFESQPVFRQLAEHLHAVARRPGG